MSTILPTQFPEVDALDFFHYVYKLASLLKRNVTWVRVSFLIL